MNRFSFRTFVATAVTAGLLFGVTGVARADNVQNDVVAGGNDTFTVGGSSTVQYRIASNNGDGETGCNATPASPSTVTINAPSGVTATPNSLAFNSCGTFQSVIFTAGAAGNYSITASVTDSGAGTFNTSPATFTLHVLAAADTTRPTLAVSHTANGAGWNSASPVSVSVSASDNVGLSSLACTVDGLSATVTPAFAAGSSYNGSLSVSGEGTHNVACTTSDAAGNTADSSNTPGAADVVEIDLTDPSLAVTHTANGAGWNTSAPVTVSVTASDGASGLAAAPNCTVGGSAATLAAGTPGSWTFSVGAEGTHPVACSVSDIAGRSANATDSVQIDTISPDIAASAKTADNATYSGGWTNQTVTVHFTCSDAGSGIAADACPADVVVDDTTATAGQSVSASVSDIAGNHADSNTIVVKVDKSGPGISHTLNPATADGSLGWYKGNVTLTWDVSEPDSPETLSKTGCVNQNVTSDTNTTFSCSASSAGGSTGPVDVTIMRDGTAPTITASATAGGAPYTSGTWTNQTVTVHFDCSDNLSGIAGTCPADVVIDENTLAAGMNVSDSVNDMAGNSTTSNTINVKVDKTAPTIVASAKTADNANYSGGWTNQTVTVHFTCEDTLSGLAGTCPTDVVISADTPATGTNVSDSVNDMAGNSTMSNTIKVEVDKTAPTGITFIGGGLSDGGTYVFGSVPDGPTGCSATDLLSGMASCSISDGYSKLVGAQSIVATATDNAGNQTTATLNYTVAAWTLNGFYQPVDMGGVLNTVKSGSTVPLKFEVFAGPTELTNTDIATWLLKPYVCTSTSTEDAIELVTTGGTSFRYDSTGGQFIYNWQTPKNKAGSCYEVTMTTTDGSKLVAKFKLK